MWRKTSRLVLSALWLRLAAALMFAAEPALATTASAAAGIFPDEMMVVGSDVRTYRLVVPETVDLSKPAALVFAFHGMGEDSKDHMPGATGLNDLAKEHKFILVYPGASGGILAGLGMVKGWALTPERAARDLAFFDALLAKLESQYHIDANQVFATGMSNGAYFAHLLGRERPDIIAAVAANSGELGLIDLAAIETARKFPILIVHGDADKIFDVANARRARDVYQAAGHPVKYIEVPGMGHEWATKVNINEQIWDFFSSHPLPPPMKEVESTPEK